MYQMPIETFKSPDDDRVLVLKQQFTMHVADDFVQIEITTEQLPALIRELQSHLARKESKAAAAPAATKFETHFWSLWPANKRKVDRAGCERKWIANNLDQHADVIADAVRRSAADPEWTKESGAFIPQPKTWLNQRRWEAPAGNSIPSDDTWNRII